MWYSRKRKANTIICCVNSNVIWQVKGNWSSLSCNFESSFCCRKLSTKNVRSLEKNWPLKIQEPWEETTSLMSTENICSEEGTNAFPFFFWGRKGTDYKLQELVLNHHHIHIPMQTSMLAAPLSKNSVDILVVALRKNWKAISWQLFYLFIFTNKGTSPWFMFPF